MSLGFVFPGQGSQSVGMLAQLAKEFAQVEVTFAEASEVLNYDLWQICQEGPLDTLNKTSTTQPAMLAAGVAVWRVWQASNGPVPHYMAGHSLGEYTALVCAGALDFTAAVQLVAQRGRFMQDAVTEGEGAMAAILGLSDEQVVAVCDDIAGDRIVEAVNFNSPGQVVIAGHYDAVQRAAEAAKAAGAKRALLLPVSVPSHCVLMKPAAEKLENLLSDMAIMPATIPVINNVDVKVTMHPDEIRKALVQQLCHPVRWVDSIRLMAELGVKSMVECGPGKVLTGLNKRIDKAISVVSVSDPVTLGKALGG